MVLLVSALVLASCSGAADEATEGEATEGEDAGGDASTSTDNVPATDADDSETDAGGDDVDASDEATEDAPEVEAVGVVRSAIDGVVLPETSITAGDTRIETDDDGRFVLTAPAGSVLTVSRPVWGEVEVEVPTDGAELEIELEPVVVRGVRVAKDVAADPERFDDLLTLIEGTTVNTLVFDTKDETNFVLYDTDVALARTIGAVDAVYDPAELLGLARERNLYTVTRIVTFEDRLWADGVPEAKLAGSWVDASDEANWAYPLALAEEACALGFDEIQFDYVRFPAGRTADIAASQLPGTSDERAAVIQEFLTEARERIRPEGCGVSAAIFGIVMSSETDEGIGQTPETVSPVVDAVSPMLYPSHYGPGWLGFADPNDHPGPVIAHALDTGEPKLDPAVLVRPWIQGFEYNGQQVQAQINESEARGAGWIIWNYPGNYRRDWLPSA